MKEEKVNNFRAAQNILVTFSKYGFQKTSMEDIGKAAGVSRQSIYKKFGSKKKCYEWAIRAYLENMYRKIFSQLNSDNLQPTITLQNVFDTLIGEAIEIVNSSHGNEILNDVLEATRNSKEDWSLRFRARLAEYLKRHKLASSSRANGAAFF